MNKENQEKPYFLRRIVAYLIDLIVVSMLATIVSMIFFNTNKDQTPAEQLLQLTDLTSKYEDKKIEKEEYDKELDTLIEKLSNETHEKSIDEAITITKQYALEEIEKEEYDSKIEEISKELTDAGVPLYSVRLLNLMNKLKNGEITSEEYNEEYNLLNYYVTKDNVPTTIAVVSVGLIYYVIMCFFCHGITLGKYVMKLQIVSANDKKLNIGNYLIRALLVDLILSNLASVIFVLTMNRETFTSIYPKVSSGLIIFLLASIIFVVYRNDGRGLHDLLANTKIISTKKVKVIEETKEEVVEAKVIEEKKDNTKKQSNKKTGGKK